MSYAVNRRELSTFKHLISLSRKLYFLKFDGDYIAALLSLFIVTLARKH